MTQAATLDKHLFVFFETEYCSYCRQMKRSTFREANIIGMLNEHFVSVCINASSREELPWGDSTTTYRELSRDHYDIQAVPTVWFLRPDGTKIDRLIGYCSGEVLLPVLQYVVGGYYDTSAAGSRGALGKEVSSQSDIR